MTATLPQFVRDLLASPPHRGGGLNLWFFKVARVLWPYRDFNEIVNLLRAAAAGEPIKAGEIERAVERSKATAWKPGQPSSVVRPAWPPVNREQREAIIRDGGGLVDLWENSPVRIEDSETHTEELIDALFPGDPLLCCGKSNSKFATRSRDEWRGKLSKLSLIVPSPMTARSGLTQDGKQSPHSLANTGSRRYLIVEFDQGDVDQHAALLLHLATSGAPMSLVVHSGSKSLHGWFYCLRQPEEKLRRFFRYAVSLGADHATWCRSQFCRMPGWTARQRKTANGFLFPPGDNPMRTQLDAAWTDGTEGEWPSPLSVVGEPETETAVDDFPKPLREVAFHGLAGDIVRRIEPHTEADRGALLIQVLTSFGNVIGRAPHATADGSRYGVNLFAVLVGETSKLRKGTSWAHVRRIFARADEQWAQDCTANGLSSGEGVIWAVRDPISKTAKGKTEIVDAGISDKRLCVIEGEYANVLKVMAREGNTLSPVIRSAWDNGTLRSMTKNSPARAIGAHVSIIGQITKDELRRLLTETESANGFANRFLFLAVRRSKCLPEGGRIDSENLNDLVRRLHDAIVFARQAGEVTRDEDARNLWRLCYDELSAGKTGLLGAITARAEAQVLRLSVNYALLDCSTKISVNHHRAALALWNYAERSARWIFGTATGDPNADRILSALRAAGKEGLTRTDITHGIFQRNIRPAVLDSALRLLVATGAAKPAKIDTGGRKAERWIAAEHLPLRQKRQN